MSTIYAHTRNPPFYLEWDSPVSCVFCTHRVSLRLLYVSCLMCLVCLLCASCLVSFLTSYAPCNTVVSVAQALVWVRRLIGPGPGCMTARTKMASGGTWRRSSWGRWMLARTTKSWRTLAWPMGWRAGTSGSNLRWLGSSVFNQVLCVSYLIASFVSFVQKSFSWYVESSCVLWNTHLWQTMSCIVTHNTIKS